MSTLIFSVVFSIWLNTIVDFNFFPFRKLPNDSMSYAMVLEIKYPEVSKIPDSTSAIRVHTTKDLYQTLTMSVKAQHFKYGIHAAYSSRYL